MVATHVSEPRPPSRGTAARRSRPRGRRASPSSRSSPASSGSVRPGGRRWRPRATRPVSTGCSSSPTASAATCPSPRPPTHRRWSAPRRGRSGEIPGLGADAITVNPLLGRDSLEPLLDSAAAGGAGVFLLVNTSNPGAADLQDLDAGGVPLHEHMAGLVDDLGAERTGDCGLSLVGAVCGRHPPRAPRAPTRADAAGDLPPARGRRPGGSADALGAGLRAPSRGRPGHRLALDSQRSSRTRR